jgi:hypothetical protein
MTARWRESTNHASHSPARHCEERSDAAIQFCRADYEFHFSSKVVMLCFDFLIHFSGEHVASAVISKTLNTFSELLDAIEHFQCASGASWYRGCRKASYALTPTLYRHSKAAQIAELGHLETDVTTRFVQRSLPFLGRHFLDDWDKLFLMQHYGVPTRLLDWSENPFVSIFFALVENGSKINGDAAIWMCDPIAWNKAALSHISFSGGILDQNSDSVRAYRPGSDLAAMLVPPVMIYGSYNSPRIVAQRGGFALFGQGTKAMEKVYLQPEFPDAILQKLIIPQGKIKDLKNSLFRKGFTESVVFPDLDGLARELRRDYGF